jgi:hypothetical protein
VEPNIVWQIDDGRCPGLLNAYRQGGGSSAPPFRRWLAVVNKAVVILSEDVEHERAKEKERGGDGAGRRIRQRPTRLARSRVDASLLGGGIASGDHVRPTTSRGLNSGGWAARPVRGMAESGDKIK